MYTIKLKTRDPKWRFPSERAFLRFTTYFLKDNHEVDLNSAEDCENFIKEHRKDIQIVDSPKQNNMLKEYSLAHFEVGQILDNRNEDSPKFVAGRNPETSVVTVYLIVAGTMLPIGTIDEDELVWFIQTAINIPGIKVLCYLGDYKWSAKRLSSRVDEFNMLSIEDKENILEELLDLKKQAVKDYWDDSRDEVGINFEEGKGEY